MCPKIIVIFILVGTVAPAAIVAEDSPTPQITAGGFTGLKSLLVECGDLAVRWDGEKLWTPSRIDFRGSRLGIEDSAYGTVFNIAGVGFIGTAHREIETEQILDVQFRLDDAKIDGKTPQVQGDKFRCERKSRVRDLELHSMIELAGNRLTETARIKANRDVRFEKVYHFMHAWRPEVTHYLYGRGDEILAGGPFSDEQADDRKFYFEESPEWVAVFDSLTGHCAVSRLQEQPKSGGAAMQLWNVQGVYRKFYLVTFLNETMPAGFDGTYHMTTEFFLTTKDRWREDAIGMAQKLEARP